jgi:hypothetical protein
MAEEQQQKPEPSARKKRQLERLARIKSLTTPKRVRVTPTSEEKRNALQRLPDRIGFRAEGSVEWPDDQFTKRRVRDGDVTVEERKSELPPPPSRPPQEPPTSAS